jgi:hypothetical protein
MVKFEHAMISPGSRVSGIMVSSDVIAGINCGGGSETVYNRIRWKAERMRRAEATRG